MNAKRNRQESKFSGVSSILVFLLPFTSSAWIVIVFLILLVAALLMYLENDIEILYVLRSREPGSPGASPRHRDRRSSFQLVLLGFRKLAKKSPLMAFVRVGRYLLFATMNAVSLVFAGRDASLSEFKSPHAKFIGNVAFMCGIVIMALYTANLAAFMTVQNMEQKISGLDTLKQGDLPDVSEDLSNVPRKAPSTKGMTP